MADLSKLFTPSGDRTTDLRWFLVNLHNYDKNKVQKMSNFQVEQYIKYEVKKQDRIAENLAKIQIQKDKKGYRSHSY